MSQGIAISTATPVEARAPRAGSRYASTAARVLLGLLFTVAGLNGLLHFLPGPAGNPMPAGAMAMAGALAQSGYFLPLLGATQALGGVLLLANRFVPLALAVLAPVVANIVAFHVFLAPQGLPVALVVLALEIGLAIAHRAAYRPMLAAR